MLRWLKHHVKTYAALHPDQREHLAVGETIVASFDDLTALAMATHRVALHLERFSAYD